MWPATEEEYNQTAVTLATELIVDFDKNSEIDKYYSKRVPMSKKIGNVKDMIVHREFFESVGCLLSEGVEFMTKEQIYQAIKEDFNKAVTALRQTK